MKISILILLIIFQFTSSCSKAKPEPVYVDAKSGLRMRTTPDLNSRIVVTIPNQSAVDVIEEKGEQVSVAGRNGKWTKISYNGKEGWVFGGFLVQKTNTAREISTNNNTVLQTDNKGCYIFNRDNFPASFTSGTTVNYDCPSYRFNKDGSAVLYTSCTNPEEHITGKWHKTDKAIVFTGLAKETLNPYGCYEGAESEEVSKKCLADMQKSSMDNYGKTEFEIPVSITITLSSDNKLQTDIAASDPDPVSGKKVKKVYIEPFKCLMPFSE